MMEAYTMVEAYTMMEAFDNREKNADDANGRPGLRICICQHAMFVAGF